MDRMNRSRFSDRPKRLARRFEREKFDTLVMPATMVCLPVAVVVILVASAFYVVAGSFPRELVGLGLAVLIIPAVLRFFRVIRGHYCDSLNEP